eukprot:7222724-Prorocentrum_lima.AAC.1
MEHVTGKEHRHALTHVVKFDKCGGDVPVLVVGLIHGLRRLALMAMLRSTHSRFSSSIAWSTDRVTHQWLVGGLGHSEPLLL